MCLFYVVVSMTECIILTVVVVNANRENNGLLFVRKTSKGVGVFDVKRIVTVSIKTRKCMWLLLYAGVCVFTHFDERCGITSKQDEKHRNG